LRKVGRRTKGFGTLPAMVPGALRAAEGGASAARRQSPSLQTLPKPSLTAVTAACANLREPTERPASKSPSNVLPMRPGYPSSGLPEGGVWRRKGSLSAASPKPKSARLETSNGSSLPRLSNARSTKLGAGRTTIHRSRRQSSRQRSKPLAIRNGKAAASFAYRGTAVRRVTKRAPKPGEHAQ
jgi:hypothetical protein